ncbi:MAG: hypothetical protein EPN64_05995 [Burkholderiaceae bacterium]|nr:MAG: hypothetical protein EPN64_05995 [Burkholderiaceae bacterium]
MEANRSKSGSVQVSRSEILAAASRAFGYDGGLQTINEADLQRLAEELSSVYQAERSAMQPAYSDCTPELHVGDSAFEGWYSSYSQAHKSDKQLARDAYAAGMGDPLVTAAPAHLILAGHDHHDERNEDDDGWPKLNQTAQVHGSVFQPGSSTRLVVEAAERFYQLEQQPSRIGDRRTILERFGEQIGALGKN